MAQDKPGVLSRVAGILGENDISIANVIQKGRGTREAVPVVIVTHEARERDMRVALAKIDRLRDGAGAPTVIRGEGGPAGATPPGPAASSAFPPTPPPAAKPPSSPPP